VLTVAAIGPAAVALGALALVCLLVARRRQDAVALWRGRGASSAQVVGGTMLEGLLIAVPPAVAAVLVAVVLVRGGPIAPTVTLAAVIAGATVAMLTIAVAAATRARAERSAAIVPGGARGSRRIVFEILLVGSAIGGAILLLQRGVRGESSVGQLSAADPFIAAVPVLIGLAVAIVALRLYPLAMRATAASAALRADLVPVHALRRASRGAGGGAILVVLLLTAAVGTFCATALVHLDRAGDAVAWHDVGASYRLTRTLGGRLPDSLELERLADVGASALAHRDTAALGIRGASVELVAVDAPRYAQVLAGTPIDVRQPSALVGLRDGRIPAIVSTALSGEPEQLAVGSTFQLTVAQHREDFVVVELRDRFPTVGLGQSFVVVDLETLGSVVGSADIAPTDALLRAPDVDPAAMRAAVSGMSGPTVAVQAQAERASALRDSSIVTALAVGVAVAAIAAAAYAALAVAAALALTGGARAPETALLRTLGLADRQTTRLVAIEYGPLMAVALASGAALGLATFALLQPGLGFAAVLGTTLAIPLAVDPVALAALVAVIVIVIGLAVALGAALQRSAGSAAVLRRGDG
jgi:putative ABC transport system permease protein